MGVGECAGEVVSPAEFTLAASERELFEAQLLLDAGHAQPAVKAAYASMVRAARGLVQAQNPAIGENEEQIIAEFTKRYYDTQLFWDKYAGGKFAEYLFKAKEFVSDGKAADADRAVQLLQEAQLFIDAAHDCHNKLGGGGAKRCADSRGRTPGRLDRSHNGTTKDCREDFYRRTR